MKFGIQLPTGDLLRDPPSGQLTKSQGRVQVFDNRTEALGVLLDLHQRGGKQGNHIVALERGTDHWYRKEAQEVRQIRRSYGITLIDSWRAV